MLLRDSCLCCDVPTYRCSCMLAAVSCTQYPFSAKGIRELTRPDLPTQKRGPPTHYTWRAPRARMWAPLHQISQTQGVVCFSLRMCVSPISLCRRLPCAQCALAVESIVVLQSLLAMMQRHGGIQVRNKQLFAFLDGSSC